MNKLIEQCSERLEQCSARLKDSYRDKNSKCLLLKTFWVNLKIIETLDKKIHQQIKEQFKNDIDIDLYERNLMKKITPTIMDKNIANKDIVDVDSYLKRS